MLTYLAITNTKQLDLTEDKQYTLTTETQMMLSGLKEPVELIGFYTPDASASRDAIRPLLDQYRLSGGGKLSYRFVDPRSDPVSADRYGVTRDGSGVVAMGEASEVTSFATEKDITEALVRLSNPEARKVYFLVGHGERDLQSAEAAGFGQVRAALESKNYEAANLNLVSQMLGHFRDGLECVLINSCWSEAQMDEIAKHIPFVIGMNLALDDRAAISFATAFYESVGNGESIPSAYEVACSAVSLEGLVIDRVAVLASQGFEGGRKPRGVMRSRGRAVAAGLAMAAVVAVGLAMQWQPPPVWTLLPLESRGVALTGARSAR